MQAQDLYNQARAAGLAAAAAAQVTPMIVQQCRGLFDNTVVREYVIDDGVCGFASIVIKNIKFANALKKMGLGRKNYGGGYALSVQDFNQSLTRKEAYAHAFAQVLNAHGITAYTDSRMD